MKLSRLAGLAAVLALCLGVSGSAAAQSNVTSADVQRLQDNIYDASRDISQVRSRDQALASQLQAELDEARRGDVPQSQAAAQRTDRPQ